ncbi:MAG: formimidoylglutamase [Flavobacteriales bacterium]
MKFLTQYNPGDLLEFFTPREGETKLGQTIDLGLAGIKQTEGEFVLIGIPEDIGPRANYGNIGAYNAWESFLTKFLSMQSNDFLTGENIILGGKIKLEDLQLKAHKASVAELRILIEMVDLRVQAVVEEILEAGKTPILIGGGHNNCYPIINSFESAIDVLNIDPHADIRKLEGRHSGNGFSYALHNKQLSKYFVLGMHEEYNSQYILNQFKENENLEYLTFNQISQESWCESMIMDAVSSHLKKEKIGLELDLDSIKNMPVSAYTPVGFSEEEIRKLIFEISQSYNFHYFHICEGAPTNATEKNIVGKTIAYFVSDFIKFNSSKS